MPNTRTLQRSFAGGEMSPEMFGRIDDVKYQTGAAKVRNFISTPQGPVENRPGLQFIKEVKDSTKKTRLVPFTYSTTQTLIIEMGAGYFRFFSNGSPVLAGTGPAWEPTRTVTSINTGTNVITSTAHGYANGTPIRFKTSGTMPIGISSSITYYVINAATDTFEISRTVGGPQVNIVTSGSGTHTFGRYYTLGEMVSDGGSNWYCVASHSQFQPPNATYWYLIPTTAYEVPNPYAEADLFDIHYVQSNDIITFVHPNYAPRELQRQAATQWPFVVISFSPSVSAPNTPSVTATVGYQTAMSAATQANPCDITTVTDHFLSVGNTVFISAVAGMTELNNKFYIVNSKPTDKRITIKEIDGGNTVNSTGFGAYVSGGFVQLATNTSDVNNYYVVTSIGDNGLDESTPSSAGNVTNNLYVNGSYNTISWNAVDGAIRYRVYKRQSGLYGFIGETESTDFVDNNIAPDMGINPPTVDTVFQSAGYYPGAVSYFEQRRCFAGSLQEPQTIYMTRSGTESDMSYTLPTKDTDRIKFRVAAREANTIRHIVPLNQLILLTSSAEWRVTSVNSDAITPSTISVRPQSYVGASNVQPEITNNSMVYCAARGGHVRELGYSWQSNGFITGDLSLRAAHLFDTYNIVEMSQSKAPQPILWFVSDSGKLLGLTYIPEQQIGAWHQHDTDGTFESCACIAENDEDVLYVVVKRTIGGNTKRYIERMASRQISTLENCFFVDSGGTYNGTNTTATTVTVSGGTTWGPADTLTITASSGIFQFPATTDVNDVIVLTATDGTQYRLRITATSSSTVASAKVDKVIAVALRNTATTVWAWARDSVSGLSHLEGKTVSILADGAVHPQRVVTSGTVSLQRPATIVHVGLPYESDLQTLPLALNIDGYGQGRYKNINKAWLRVFQSSGIFVGPDENNLVEAKQRTNEPYGSPPALKTAEILVLLTPSWQDSGQVYVRQADPLPLTIVGMTLEVSLGG